MCLGAVFAEEKIRARQGRCCLLSTPSGRVALRRVRGLAGKENVEKVGKFLQQQRKEAAKRES